MRKNILTGVSVALVAVATISAAQTTAATTPDLPFDVAPTNPAFDLRKDLDTLSVPCGLLIRLNVRFRMTGTIRGRRVDAAVRLSAVPTVAMRLEPVVASGSPPFVLQANRRPGVDDDEDGTLFIRQGNRVVRDKLSALIEAVIGLPINEQELFEIFTGCPTSWSSADLYRLGSDWFKLLTPYGDDAVLETYWLRDRSHPWTYSAAIHYTLSAPERKWRIDFLEGRPEVFVRLRIRSMNWLGELDRQDDITLLREFAWIDANGIQGAATIPAAAREISLVELKSAIPLITTPSIQRSPSPQARQPARR